MTRGFGYQALGFIKKKKEERRRRSRRKFPVRAAQSPRRWRPSCAGHGWKAIPSSPGSAAPTGRNLCRDLGRTWTPGISPSPTAAAPGTTTERRLRAGLVLHHTVHFTALRSAVHRPGPNWRRPLAGHQLFPTPFMRLPGRLYCLFILISLIRILLIRRLMG